jgi:hypothetical protein
MPDKFSCLTLRQAIAVQIFYSSPDDENLIGKTLNSEKWDDPVIIVESIIFRSNESGKDETLEKLISERAYHEILLKYDKLGGTYKMLVTYKNVNGEIKEVDLTHAIESALSPVELPEEIIQFLLEREEFAYLK